MYTNTLLYIQSNPLIRNLTKQICPFYLTLVTFGGFGPLRSHGHSKSGTTIFKTCQVVRNEELFSVLP